MTTEPDAAGHGAVASLVKGYLLEQVVRGQITDLWEEYELVLASMVELRATRDDPDTQAIRDFNRAVAADERFECVMLAVSDGLTLLRVC